MVSKNIESILQVINRVCTTKYFIGLSVQDLFVMNALLFSCRTYNMNFFKEVNGFAEIDTFKKIIKKI